MIAINIPKKRIVFKSGLTSEQKYALLCAVWFRNYVFINYDFPEVKETDTPNAIYFK